MQNSSRVSLSGQEDSMEELPQIQLNNQQHLQIAPQQPQAQGGQITISAQEVQARAHDRNLVFESDEERDNFKNELFNQHTI
mmetsp:Transcript_32338/g.40078  ORF Transcript_32338/g.40078 Transcript_32338/m.40078 type:complete len:82 (-) Transcript_32338:203-448(-)